MQKAMKRSKTTQIRGSTSTNNRNREQIQLTGKLADRSSASPRKPRLAGRLVSPSSAEKEGEEDGEWEMKRQTE
jgi:hypothetical protein